MSELDGLAAGTGRAARQARRTLKRRTIAAARGGGIDDLAPLTEALDGLAARIAPAERLALSREIATDLRTANAARIRGNVEPDGEPMVPRKPRGNGKARTRRLRDPVTRLSRLILGGPMFKRAAGPRYLRKESSQGEAQVGFVGAMARIMRVHQYGLRDTVTRGGDAPEVTYPARVVLGMTPDDRLRILDRIAGRLQP